MSYLRFPVQQTMIDDELHSTQDLLGEAHLDRHPLYGQSALDASSAYPVTSQTMCLMVTCHWITYHPVYPHHLSAMIARPLRRSLKGLLRIYDHILSRLVQINSVYFDDTHAHRHGSQRMKRNSISYLTPHCYSDHPPSVRSQCTRYRAVCPPTPLRHFLT